MSDSRPHYNMNNPSVRRIMKEIKEMQAEKSTLYTAMPLDVRIYSIYCLCELS